MGDHDPGELLTVGKITGCYGIKGWVKVHSYTDPQENFLKYGGWVIRRREGPGPIDFDAGKRHGKGLVAHIRGVDDRTTAESYQGLEVAVPAGSLPALEEGDFYWHQLEGLEVWCGTDDGDVLLGTVDYLIETGANDVLVVKASARSIDERERLIPYLPGDVVRRVDLEAGRIEVDWFPDE
ncbi:ribosome maturation factor RimM [Parahaliea mediterranea]|uniref:Ribosome maturation factor RimM n=1 Tax=Parahaliea mediterranea TaxID=651086 RepID=A0A939IJ89_9GAMM|nr:ribosome maturation factor RimM [Parahaliea mediterranea]MBN7796036.1 ribosome maturation factor RimM [Parahaliea mediterranea]